MSVTHHQLAITGFEQYHRDSIHPGRHNNIIILIRWISRQLLPPQRVSRAVHLCILGEPAAHSSLGLLLRHLLLQQHLLGTTHSIRYTPSNTSPLTYFTCFSLNIWMNPSWKSNFIRIPAYFKHIPPIRHSGLSLFRSDSIRAIPLRHRLQLQRVRHYRRPHSLFLPSLLFRQFRTIRCY